MALNANIKMKMYLNEFEQDQENDQIRFDKSSTYLQI